jgi:hypothetical protein
MRFSADGLYSWLKEESNRSRLADWLFDNSASPFHFLHESFVKKKDQWASRSTLWCGQRRGLERTVGWSHSEAD